MMSNKITYVPILKWKRAEQNALKNMTEARKEAMMPLIELVMPKPKEATAEEYHDKTLALATSDKIRDYVKAIEKSWGQRLLFMDFTWIYNECKTRVAREAIDNAISNSLNIIPVINIFDSEELKNLILEKRNQHSLDVAIRISSLDLGNIDELNRRIGLYIKLPGSLESKTHIIVDLKDIRDKEEYLRLASISQNILNRDRWKSFILASGSFPIDLSECDPAEPTILPRNDWLWWKDFINSNPNRLPIFADYGIRHPIYFESHLVLHPTTSIKYTLASGWQIYKGKRRDFGKYLANAVTLVSTNEYYGKDFSFGDDYINQKAEHFSVWSRVKLDEEKRQKNGEIIGKSKAKGTGSTESWLSAGLNHHMSVAVDQVSS